MPSTSSNIDYRKFIRMSSFDYSSPGAYFVTILTYQRQPLFGNLENGLMHLSPLGDLASSVWLGLSGRFTEVEIDELIVMPDHFHGILILKNEELMQNKSISALNSPRLSLGTLIATYKSTVTRVFHFNNPGNKQQIWHRNYYEHIIRDKHELDQIRNYIQENPTRGESDESIPQWK